MSTRQYFLKKLLLETQIKVISGGLVIATNKDFTFTGVKPLKRLGFGISTKKPGERREVRVKRLV
jgi:hypothetical protein